MSAHAYHETEDESSRPRQNTNKKLRLVEGPALVELAAAIKNEHSAVRRAASQVVARAQAAGTLLIAAKKQLPHGDWLPWLRDHCDMSLRTAQNYMRLARLSPEAAQRIAHLPLGEALRTVATPLADEGELSTVFSNDRIEAAAFEHFRQTGFPYRDVPVHVAMQAINRLATTKMSALGTSTVAHDVADSYHPHRFRGCGHGRLSAVDGFERDDVLQRALRKELETGKSIPSGHFSGLSIVSGVQPCANFRPGVACQYYRRFCPENGTVLDTSTGYGGRLVGFIASGRAGRYIGIDPCRETHDGNRRLAADLGFTDAVELHCKPAEDIDPQLFRGQCDFAFTSPPYFSKEHYTDDATQSWRRYPSADKWREGFLRPMLRLQFESLKAGALSVINIDNVKIMKRHYELTRWTTELAAEVGFELVSTERLKMPQLWGSVNGFDVSEPVFVFRKPA
jgi:hypothetical protein